MHGERGQTGADMAGVLLLVALIVGGLASSGIPATIADHTSDLVCRISGGDCAAPDPQPVAADSGEDTEEPAGPIFTDQPLPVLPFPGSVAVRCTYAEGSETPCSGPEEPGVSVQATGELSVERSETALDSEGCPQQTLSVTTTLELAASASAEGAHAGGSLEAHLGESTTYGVTVAPDAAEAIEDGDRPPPNPLDPTTVGAGESVELSREYYAGVGLDANYEALRTSLGYDEGRRVSSGVQRVDASTVRVVAGDEDFVRHALSLGIGADWANVSLGGSKDFSEGTLHAVDIDISTTAGWNAYQEFLASGTLPSAGTPGTSDPTTSETATLTEELSAELTLGNATFGSMLQDSGANVTETTNADGTVEVALDARLNDVGFAMRYRTQPTSSAGTRETADGEPIGDPEYSLLLEDVDTSMAEQLQEVEGDDPNAPDGHLRIDFTTADLEEIQELARERIADQVESETGDRPSDAELDAVFEDGDAEGEIDGNHYDFDGPLDDYGEIAAAQSPEDVLIGLYHLGPGGASGDLAYALLSMWGDEGPVDFPGDIVTPDCG